MAITWISRRLEQFVGGLRPVRIVDTRIEHFTADLCTILGYEPETLKGAWLSEIEHPDDRWQGKVNAYVRHLGQSAKEQYIVRWQNYDSGWVYFKKHISPTAFVDSWLVKAEVVKEGDFIEPVRQSLDAMGIDEQGWTAYNGKYDQRSCVETLNRTKDRDDASDPSLDSFTPYMILSNDASEKSGRLYRSRQTGRTRRQYVCRRCGWGWMGQAGRDTTPMQCPECHTVNWWKTATE